MPTSIIVEDAEFGRDSAGVFVQYNISVKDGDNELNNVQRRYRDFQNFDGSWRKLYPNINAPLPPSVFFGANSPGVVGQRIVGLTNYLRVLAEIKSVIPLVSAFLQVRQSVFSDMQPRFQQPAPRPSPPGPPKPRPKKEMMAKMEKMDKMEAPAAMMAANQQNNSGPAGPGPAGPRPGGAGSPAPMMAKDMDCFNCGVPNKGAPFCSNCGEKQPKPEPPQEPMFDPSESHVCGQCGVDGTGNFCNSCGFKMAPEKMQNSSPSSSRSSSSSMSLSASSQSSAGSFGGGPGGSPPRGPPAGPPGRGPPGGSPPRAPRGGPGGPLPGFGNIGGAIGGPRGGFGGGAPPPVARKPTVVRNGGTPAPGGRTPFRGGAASPAAPSEAGSSYSRFPSAAPSEAGYDGNAPNELSPPPGEFIGDIYEGRKLRRRKSFLKATTKDHWKVQNMSMVSRLLDKNRDAYCIFSDTALVYDPNFKSTKRILMMTDKAVYLLSPGTLTAKWRINIRDIGAISMSTQADHFFVVHPADNNQPDQMILCPRKTELLVALRYVMAVQFRIGLEMSFSDDISVMLKPRVRSVVTFREKQSFGDESVNLQVMDRGAVSGATITVSVPPNLLADPFNDAAEQQRVVEDTEAQLFG